MKEENHSRNKVNERFVPAHKTGLTVLFTLTFWEEDLIRLASFYQDLLRGRGAGGTTISNIADPETGNHYIRVWTSKFSRGALLEHSGQGWRHPVIEWKMRSKDRIFVTFIVEIENSEARDVTYEFAPNDSGVSGENSGEWTSQVRDIREQLGENEVFASISQMKIRACFISSCQAPGEVDIDYIRFVDSL